MFGTNPAAGDFELIFNFHGVGEPPAAVTAAERPYWLTPERFDAILDLIATHDGARRVYITFDDGNSSDIAIALPILLSRNLRASFFITTNAISTPGFISVAGIVELHEAGMGIGSHGVTHEPFTTRIEQLAAEVTRSLSILSNIIQRPVTEVAVPFGAYNPKVLRTLRQVGVTRVFTSDNGFTPAGAWLAPRNTVRMDTPVEAIVSLIRDGSPSARLQRAARDLANRLGRLAFRKG